MKNLIESNKSSEEITKQLTEEKGEHWIEVSVSDALKAHNLIMDNSSLAKQQPTYGSSNVFEFDDEQSLIDAEELLKKYNVEIEQTSN